MLEAVFSDSSNMSAGIQMKMTLLITVPDHIGTLSQVGTGKISKGDWTI